MFGLNYYFFSVGYDYYYTHTLAYCECKSYVFGACDLSVQYFSLWAWMFKSTRLTELFESLKTKYNDEKGKKITNEKSKGRSNDYISLLKIYYII
jgi:hypothetical protein